MGFRKKHDITDIYHVRDEKKPESLRLPDPVAGKSRSKHYHNYFRGYTEIRTVTEKGRIKIERYYTKPWIVSDLSPKKYWLVRLLYAVLTVISVVLYIAAMIQDIPGNLHWVVALPGLPSMILLFLLVIVCFLYITVPKKMTLWDHESSTKRIKKASLATGIVQAVTAMALIGFTIATGLEVVRSLQCVAVVLVAAICSGAMFFIERKVPYTEIPNDTKLPSGEAHEIR